MPKHLRTYPMRSKTYAWASVCLIGAMILALAYLGISFSW